jgi:hypothetical protein
MRSALLSLFVLACSGGGTPYLRSGPGVVIPTTFGEGSSQPESASSAARPPPSAAPPPAPVVSSPPDPEPLRQAEQWEYEIAWDAGTVTVLSTVPRKFPNPVVTARRMGRFAVELWIGHELVERVRFDFPLLALDDANSGTSARAAPPSLERGARTRQRVLVPAAARARRALLVDRASDKVVELPWPPTPSAAQ